MKSKVSERLSDIHDYSRKELIQRAKEFSKQFRIKDGKDFKLKDFDPGEDAGMGAEDKPLAKEALQLGVAALSTMQEILYAQDKWAVLLIFQAMDAAGKDGAIRHVMSGINPQGCQVTSYKAPSAEELDHDYLWRCTKNLPERGRIGIFNRSYYEEVLAVRVHEKFLKNQKLPEELITKDIWDDRLNDIRNFESYLNRNGIAVCKFFLNLSKKEQKKRFLARIHDPEKQWKFSPSDAKERKYWDHYMKAYEELIRHTAAKDAPWYVVPADNKAFSRVVVASAIIQTMDSLGLKYPKVSEEKLAELKRVEQELMAED
ncbi:MAG TPA: polyphosphate kinase 2 family protein [Puia sp.]|jgi:PPK2 family polyphosphate:nucleotide phosphotransferase|nr:polyphosphate kinase 2 family protein [Puia sp.]HZZ74622.1 polyphosphate kinase 2 family protein [Puia sp.]